MKMFIFAKLRGVVANKKAVGGTYHDVIVYVTVGNYNGIHTDG